MNESLTIPQHKNKSAIISERNSLSLILCILARVLYCVVVVVVFSSGVGRTGVFIALDYFHHWLHDHSLDDEVGVFEYVLKICMNRPFIIQTRVSRELIVANSVDSVPAFEAVGRRIDLSQWTQLQFGLFSVPTSGPQLVYQRPWYVLFCLWKSAYKRSFAAYRKE